MPILPSGDLFAPGPVVSGSKLTAAHCWRYCPYSTQITDYNQNAEVPGGEKIYHQETNGQMHTYSLGGGYLGWICADNGCSYYAGTATTEVTQHGRRFVPASGTTALNNDLPTLSGSVEALEQGRKIVSGTRYFQI
jgi:hypothetical protein